MKVKTDTLNKKPGAVKYCYFNRFYPQSCAKYIGLTHKLNYLDPHSPLTMLSIHVEELWCFCDFLQNNHSIVSGGVGFFFGFSIFSLYFAHDCRSSVRANTPLTMEVSRVRPISQTMKKSLTRSQPRQQTVSEVESQVPFIGMP